MKSRIRVTSLTLITLFSALLMLQFQNCAKNPAQFSDKELQKTMNFFEYRYTKATDIYFEIQLVVDTEDATHRLYKVLGFAANSNGATTNIEYSMQLFDQNGAAICPEETGVLAAGTTLAEESCLMTLQTVIGSAVIKVRNPGGEWNVYTKKYQ